MRYKFTDTELKKVMSNLTILIDTREQANEHVIEFLTKKKIPYEVKKLDFGDYACMLPANSFEGQERAIYFDRDIVIERKNGIDEVAGNLKDDTRILKELAHLNKYNIKYYVFLEEPEMNETLRGLNAGEKKHLKEFMKILESKKVCLKPEGFDFNIRKGNYRSEYQPKSLYARLKTIEARYNTVIRPIDKQFMGSEIYNTFYYYVREVLKNKGFIEEVVENE